MSENNFQYSSLGAMIKEPLLQFIVLGLGIFLIDGYLSRNEIDSNKVIVDDQKLSELIRVFEEGQGRTPSSKEVENLIVTWTQNEILFREGQQLKLHEGDEMIRSRLVLKMRNILLNRVVVEDPSEETLINFYQQNQQFYADPKKISFEIVDINGTEEDAENVLKKMNDDIASSELSFKTRLFPSRPEETLIAFFKPASVENISKADINRWMSVQSTSGNWHIVKLTERKEARVLGYSEVRAKVLQDWHRISKDKQLANQTKSIIDQYDIVVNPSDELLEKYNIDKQEKQSSLMEKKNKLTIVQGG